VREALHVIDRHLVYLPIAASNEVITNIKKLAKKGLYQCPYCKANLIVKSGDERGLHFSHLHSEACVESKKIDQAERKYRKQTERETKKQKVLVDFIYDELSKQSKLKEDMYVEYGYKAKTKLKEYPDIIVKNGEKEFAITIVTNVNPLEDGYLAKQVIKRHDYFIQHKMEPIWFIEKKEQSIEQEKQSLILWEAELTISSKTVEDRKWDYFLNNIIKDKEFFTSYNYPLTMNKLEIDVKGMYYLYTNDDRTVVKVQRFLKDRTEKPYRAFLINHGYEMAFADALLLKNDFLLSDPNKEEEARKNFKERYNQLLHSYNEKLRLQDEERKQKINEYREQLKRTLNELIEQNDCSLPLSIEQVEYLSDIETIQEYKTKHEQVLLLTSLSKVQKKFLSTLNKKQFEEVIQKLINKVFYHIELPDKLDDHEIMIFKELELPFLDEQLERIKNIQHHQYSREIDNDDISSTFFTYEKSTTTITYEELMKRHLETLKLVRQHQSGISPGLVKDWISIQESIKILKNSGDFNYSSFRTLIKNLLNQLHIEYDEFLKH
jgi:hypothetical protein